MFVSVVLELMYISMKRRMKKGVVTEVYCTDGMVLIPKYEKAFLEMVFTKRR